MSAKCGICGTRIFDEDGQCYGTQLSSDVWVCNTADCSEFALEVVSAARNVIELYDISDVENSMDVYDMWDIIEKLRRALIG